MICLQPRSFQRLLQICVLLLPWISIILNLHLFRRSSSRVRKVKEPFAPPRGVVEAQSRIEHALDIEHPDKLQSIETYRTYPMTANWQNSTILPTWIKDYFHWHQQQRRSTTTKLNNDTKFLILRCLKNDTKCGGTADRLQPLPFVVMIAARTKRVLLIHWERPYPLQEFLVPPVNGIDWRLPSFLQNYTFSKPDLSVLKHMMPYLQKNNNSRPRKPLPRVATMLYQSHGHGANQYNQLQDINEPTYEQVFPHIWNAFFVPSPPIQSRIQQSMQELHLQSNQYVAVHIRSLYHSYNTNQQLRNLVRNALNCASQLNHDNNNKLPIYIATDDADRTTQAALDYASKRGANVVARRPSDQESRTTLHLDRGLSFLSKNASYWTTHTSVADYYDTFVDLYLLAQSKCIAFHVGNYGRWANLLSSNQSCQINHLKNTCPWNGD